MTAPRVAPTPALNWENLLGPMGRTQVVTLRLERARLGQRMAAR
jgi:hypothetical protein